MLLEQLHTVHHEETAEYLLLICNKKRAHRKMCKIYIYCVFVMMYSATHFTASTINNEV